MARTHSDIADELERLMTLDRAQIEQVRTGDTSELLEFSHAEHAELCERADHEAALGNHDAARYFEQEASAWRTTLRLIRSARATAAGGGAEVA